MNHESGQIILKTGVSPQNTNAEGSVCQDNSSDLNAGQSVKLDDLSKKGVEKRSGNNHNEVLYKSDANMESIHVGDYIIVRQNISEPVLGWDGIRHNCVGLVKAIHGTPGSDLVSAIVQFREQENWEGLVDDLELANEPDPVVEIANVSSAMLWRHRTHTIISRGLMKSFLSHYWESRQK